MKIINKRNFFPLICISFTVVTLAKTIIEALFINVFDAYQINLWMIFMFCTLTILILSQHCRIFQLPFVLAVIIQYLSVVLVMMFFTWVLGFFTELAHTAYRDMFVSTSIIYLIISAIYYIYFHIELKKHNLILKKLKKLKKI